MQEMCLFTLEIKSFNSHKEQKIKLLITCQPAYKLFCTYEYDE